MSASPRAFTLIEILIVMGLLAMLATTVLIAINPTRLFAQARDTQRMSDMNAILNAIGQRMADNKGVFHGRVGTSDIYCQKLPSLTTDVLSSTATSATANTEGGNLGCLSPIYIASLPRDPSIASGNTTGYQVNINSAGRITISSPSIESSIPRTEALSIQR